MTTSAPCPIDDARLKGIAAPEIKDGVLDLDDPQQAIAQRTVDESEFHCFIRFRP